VGELVDLRGLPLSRAKCRNPMLDYPKMLPCWCGSGKASKRCCLPKMAKEIPVRDAKAGDQYMAYVRERMAEIKDWQPERKKLN
jgi:uncharacterized protein YchJ